jgi:hypothetical protein
MQKLTERFQTKEDNPPIQEENEQGIETPFNIPMRIEPVSRPIAANEETPEKSKETKEFKKMSLKEIVARSQERVKKTSNQKKEEIKEEKEDPCETNENLDLNKRKPEEESESYQEEMEIEDKKPEKKTQKKDNKSAKKSKIGSKSTLNKEIFMPLAERVRARQEKAKEIKGDSPKELEEESTGRRIPGNSRSLFHERMEAAKNKEDDKNKRELRPKAVKKDKSDLDLDESSASANEKMKNLKRAAPEGGFKQRGRGTIKRIHLSLTHFNSIVFS